MKSFLRACLLNGFSLFVVAGFYPGLIIPASLFELLWAGLIFTLINYLVKPIIKLLLLPVNLITLGLFGWIANVFVLIITSKVYPQLTIVSFISPQISWAGFVIPELHISLLPSFVLASFFISLVYNLFNQLLTES